VSAAGLCLLDGRLVPLAEARISPLDRGFLFGDAVYETLKVAGGRALFRAQHLERLARSLAALRIPMPAGLVGALDRLLDAAALASGALYLQVSRGAAAERRHLPPPELAPTLFALPVAIDFPAEPWLLPGLAAVTRADLRWRRCDVKTTALAATVLAGLDAAAAGADELIWSGAAGELREGGHTNLFVRDERGWHTHPLGPEILAGVTRGLLLEAGARAGLPVEERAPRLDERAGWREAFVCGTLTGVRALVRLDGAPVGDGAPGEQTRRFARRLAEAEAREAAR
jgi:D-alanine transaminase